MEEGEIESSYSNNATSADTELRLSSATHQAARHQSLPSSSSRCKEEDADRTYYTINHSQSSTDSHDDGLSTQVVGEHSGYSVQAAVRQPEGPPVPRRPSWTIQAGQEDSPPQYCVLGQQANVEVEVRLTKVSLEESR